MANNTAFVMSKEKIKEFIDSSPESRLKWLEEANEFVKKFVDPKKRALWEKLNSSQNQVRETGS